MSITSMHCAETMKAADAGVGGVEETGCVDCPWTTCGVQLTALCESVYLYPDGKD